MLCRADDGSPFVIAIVYTRMLVPAARAMIGRANIICCLSRNFMKKSIPIALSCLFAALIMPPALHAAQHMVWDMDHN